MTARRKRVLHSELGLFWYLWYSYWGTSTNTICTNANHVLYECFIISHTCLQCTPHSSNKTRNNKGPANRSKHTQIHMHTTAWFTENSASSIFWQGVQDKEFSTQPSAVWLCHWYKTRLVCVCTSAVHQHITLYASVRKWNSCNPNQISFSQPQRALKLLKVPDLHLHLLLFKTG